MVELSGYIIIPEEELELVKKALKEHSALTLEEPGCLAFEITAHESDLCRFGVYERFVDQAAFEAHQQRIKASAWGKISQNVQRFYSQISK